MDVEAAPDSAAAAVDVLPDITAAPAPDAAASTAGWPVPPLVRVVEWASAVLDAQLASLPSNPETRQVGWLSPWKLFPLDCTGRCECNRCQLPLWHISLAGRHWVASGACAKAAVEVRGQAPCKTDAYMDVELCLASAQLLEGMRAAVEGQAAEAARLLGARGSVEHLRNGAPLPAPQDAASLYTLEPLALSQL